MGEDNYGWQRSTTFPLQNVIMFILLNFEPIYDFPMGPFQSDNLILHSFNMNTVVQFQQDGIN